MGRREGSGVGRREGSGVGRREGSDLDRREGSDVDRWEEVMWTDGKGKHSEGLELGSSILIVF